MLPLPPDIDVRLASIGALQEPARRALYLHVLAQGRAVSRDEAAEAVGVRRGLAAFHLDRLASDGLLEVEYRRLSGRSGPGAGRPSKLYRTARTEYEVTLPPRAYALAADLLAEAVEASQPGGSGQSPENVARERGEAIGRSLRNDLGSRPSATARRGALERALAAHGYQPSSEGRDLRLRNCPFHALAERHTTLVCGMNQAWLEGMLAGLGMDRLRARLAATPGACCVVLEPAGRARRGT